MAIISVEGVSKRYRKGVTGYRTLREDLYALTGSLVHLTRRSQREDDKHIWALRDVSFEVQPGEKVGIIGRNGCGKTTLLRLLAGITKPTKGKIEVRGRLGVLIELMAGFHPELTGRENIFLNGAIMGMSQKEIRRKLDEIVHFAGIEEFIDTPIKRYSSGMHVRLGFAVAAHLEPDVLLVDEVLAVGDAEFQKKCLGKMDEVAGEGRTVLFVSHNMESIRRLCPRTVLLDAGRLVCDAATDDVIGRYLTAGREECGVRVYNDDDAPGNEYLRLRSVRLLNSMHEPATVFSMAEPICCEMAIEMARTMQDFHVYIRVYTKEGILVFVSADWDDDLNSNCVTRPGSYLVRCTIPQRLLNNGSYLLTVGGVIPNQSFVFTEESVLQWEVTQVGGVGGQGSTGRAGVIRPQLVWTVTDMEAASGERLGVVTKD